MAGGEIFRVTSEMASEQVATLTEEAKQSPILYFDDFMNCLEPLYRKYELPDEVKIPRSLDEMIKGDFSPARVIDLRPIKERMVYGEFPIWRNPSNKEFSLHGFGLIENNKARPSEYSLFDTSPHMFLGGATGHGKSVTLNDIIMAGALVHPPWKVQFYLNDPKITELKPYALYKNVMPHVNTVAATEDANYTISMLEYLIAVMFKRNKVFTEAGVKNINAFNEKTGLSMAMLVLVLDECKSMYLRAARLATYIDGLIEQYVALARNAGGRCIMASQQVVTEMSKDTMANVNQRACLGCNAAVSTAVIGNVGAAINLGQMGRLVINQKPGDGQIKDNVHIVSPFLPDNVNPHSKVIYEVFDWMAEIWDLCGGGRLEPLSFFDEQAELTRSEFVEYVDQHARMSEFFLGEPSFIYKAKHKFYHCSLVPKTKLDSARGYNFLCVSPIATMRYNMVAILLANLQAINRKSKIVVNVVADFKDTADKVEALGFHTDSVDYSTDIEQAFYKNTCAIFYRQLLCQADERIFSGKEPVMSEVGRECIELANLGTVSDLMNKRFYMLLNLLQESKSKLILQLDDLTSKSAFRYAGLLAGFYNFYKKLNCESKQVMPSNFASEVTIFVEFDKVKGVEIKTATAKLEQWGEIVNAGPAFRKYTFVVASLLPNSASSLGPYFRYLLFYAVPQTSVNAYKIQNDYPENIGSMLYVFTDKELPEKRCSKIKFPKLLDISEDDSEE